MVLGRPQVTRPIVFLLMLFGGIALAEQKAKTKAVDVEVKPDEANKPTDGAIEYEAVEVKPVKELKGFERVPLAPGERRTVTFPIGPEQLQFYDREMERRVEPGEFELTVGSSSEDGEAILLTVVED